MDLPLIYIIIRDQRDHARPRHLVGAIAQDFERASSICLCTISRPAPPSPKPLQC
jgi:hypothetical protein